MPRLRSELATQSNWHLCTSVRTPSHVCNDRLPDTSAWQNAYYKLGYSTGTGTRITVQYRYSNRYSSVLAPVQGRYSTVQVQYSSGTVPGTVPVPVQCSTRYSTSTSAVQYQCSTSTGAGSSTGTVHYTGNSGTSSLNTPPPTPQVPIRQQCCTRAGRVCYHNSNAAQQ